MNIIKSGVKKNKISNYNKMKIPNPYTKYGQRRLKKIFEIGKSKKDRKVLEYTETIGYEGKNLEEAYEYLADYYEVLVNDKIIEENDDKVLLLFDATIRPYYEGKGKKKYGNKFMRSFKKIVSKKDLLKEYNKLIEEFNSYINDKDVWKDDYDYTGADVKYTAPKEMSINKAKAMGIQKRYALNKSNYVENEVWDTGRDMCFVDWIQYRYSPNRTTNKRGYNLNKILKLGDKYKREDSDVAIEYFSTHTKDGERIENLTLTPNKDGYDIKHIDLFCKNMNINMVALVNNKIIHTGLYKKSNGNIPSLVFELNSGHIYPLIDSHKIKGWVNKAKSQLVHIDNVDIKKIKTDEKPYLPKFQKPKHTKIFDINSGKLRDANPLEYYLNLINNELKTLPTYPYNLRQKNGHILPLKMKDKIYYHHKKSTEMELTIDYLKEKDINFTGQCPQTFTAEYMNNCNELLLAQSYYSPDVNYALDIENIKNRVHFGLVSEDSKKYFDNNKNINSYDINKCYRKSMEDLDYLLHTDFNCNVETDYIYPDVSCIYEGLYYVETEDNTLFHGNNWYSDRIVRYGYENNIINGNNIRAKIRCKKTNNNPLKNIIKNISEEFNNKHLQKIIINSIYGWLAKTSTKKNDIYIDEDPKRIYDNWLGKRGLESKELYLNKYYVNTDHQWIRDYVKDGLFDIDELLEINETKEEHEKIRRFYTYGEREKIKHFYNYLPVAIQIQDEANIQVHKLLKKTRGKLLFRKTDMVCVYGGKDLQDSEEIGGHRRCENPTLPLTLESNKSAELCIYDTDWNNLKYNDSKDYENIINNFIENGGGLLLGRAGTGKSYVAKQGMKIMNNKNINFIATAYTNKATIQLEGSTLHSFLRLSKDNNNITSKWANIIKNKYDVIIIDEISMIGKDLWKPLIQLKNITGIIFILVGDYRQLPPVEKNEEEDEWDIPNTDWFKHPVVHYLANGNRCELTSMKRYDKELWKVLEDIWEKEEFNILDEGTKASTADLVNSHNLCYTNRTRKIINQKCMKHHIIDKDYLLIPYEATGNTEKDKQHQDTYLYVGLPLYMRITTDDKLFKKNEKVKCKKFDNNNFTIINCLDMEIEFEIKDFHSKVQAGYAATFHKSQGDTCNGNVNIFDCSNWKKQLDRIHAKKTLYTALSRATRLDNIKIRNGFKK